MYPRRPRANAPTRAPTHQRARARQGANALADARSAEARVKTRGNARAIIGDPRNKTKRKIALWAMRQWKRSCFANCFASGLFGVLGGFQKDVCFAFGFFLGVFSKGMPLPKYYTMWGEGAR